MMMMMMMIINQVHGEDGESPLGKVKDAIKLAIDIGYWHFDCAHVYENEDEIGDAIQEKIQKQAVAREDLFVVSKIERLLNKPGLKYKPVINQVLRLHRMIYVKRPVFIDREPSIPASGRTDKFLQVQRDFCNCVLPPWSSQMAIVLIRFQIQRNVSVIPKSVTPHRIKENFENGATRKNLGRQVARYESYERKNIIFPSSVPPGMLKNVKSQVFDFELTPEEIQTLLSSKKRHRICTVEK
ncbi:hypothetical protein JD844_028739 [Phrynosoma platyrhinos]|uniref:NADP-dependent oxidoreductase domain-containing protein n=1 Tax=Phrynosoma platyrhinos TaxID=52577 RepID=A0ABQ7SIA1_PHRPL|nr:hypothetical protein JD844_028739 [Phrynosoma platyrhinos]